MLKMRLRLLETFLELTTTKQTPEPSHFLMIILIDIWNIPGRKFMSNSMFFIVRFKTSLLRLEEIPRQKGTSIVADF